MAAGYQYARAVDDEFAPPPPPYSKVKDDAMGGAAGPDLEAGIQQQFGTEMPAMDFEKELRLGFIRKVYGVLSLQLLLTCVTVSVMVLVDSVRVFVLSHPGLLYVAFFLSIGLLLTLLCYQGEYPTNAYLLGVWTFVEAYTVGVVCASFASAGAGALVVEAAALTTVIFLGLTAFTFQSKIDFSFLGGALFACLSILLLWSFVNMIFGWVPGVGYSLVGAILFSLYIVFDTYLLTQKLQPDQWVQACISLYLDILNLFLMLLQLLASGRER